MKNPALKGRENDPRLPGRLHRMKAFVLRKSSRNQRNGQNRRVGGPAPRSENRVVPAKPPSPNAPDLPCRLSSVSRNWPLSCFHQLSPQHLGPAQSAVSTVHHPTNRHNKHTIGLPWHSLGREGESGIQKDPTTERRRLVAFWLPVSNRNPPSILQRQSDLIQVNPTSQTQPHFPSFSWIASMASLAASRMSSLGSCTRFCNRPTARGSSKSVTSEMATIRTSSG